jgi:ABC-2 type transport system permease protein
MDPPMIKYMEQIVSRFGGGVKIQLPPPTSQLAMVQFLQDLTQLAGFAVVLLAAGSVAGEKKSGLASWYLAQPLSRARYLGEKWLAYAAMITLGVAGSGAVAYFYCWSLLGPLPASGAWRAALGVAAFLLFILSATLLGSALFSFAGAGIVGFLLGYGGYALKAPAQAAGLYRFFPQSLPGSAADILAGVYPAADFYWGLFSCLLLTGLLFWLTALRFGALELR